MRPIQEIRPSHIKKFIKTVFKELESRIHVYAAIVVVIALITLTSRFDGWQGLTAIGTISMAFAVFLLEVLLPYVMRPRLTITFDQDDKKYCREARIREWGAERVESKPKQKNEAIHEAMNSELPPAGPYETIPHNGVLYTSVGETHTFSLPSMNAAEGTKSHGELRIGNAKNGYFIRIKVQNTGRSLARKCQGVIAEVALLKGDFDETEYFVPLILHWANRSPKLHSDPIDLNPGAHWYLDVVYTKEDSDSLHVYHIFTGEPIGTIDKFKEGKYRFKVIMYAENSQPTEKWLKVKWGGSSHKDIKATLE